MQWTRGAQMMMYSLVEHRNATLTQWMRIWDEAERLSTALGDTFVKADCVERAASAENVNFLASKYQSVPDALD